MSENTDWSAARREIGESNFLRVQEVVVKLFAKILSGDLYDVSNYSSAARECGQDEFIEDVREVMGDYGVDFQVPSGEEYWNNVLIMSRVEGDSSYCKIHAPFVSTSGRILDLEMQLFVRFGETEVDVDLRGVLTP